MSPLTFLFVCVFLAFAHAAPLVKRIVVDPPITSPTASTVWTVGDKVNVTWDASIVPSGNFSGTLVLGAQTSDSENLQLDNPLAEGFDLHSGTVEITVPNVASGTNYIVVLFGDSGNASPQFTISGGSSSSAIASSTVSQPTSSVSPSSATPTAPGSSATTSPEIPSSTPLSMPTAAATSSAASGTSVAVVTESSFSTPSSSSSPSVSAAQDQGDVNGALSTHANALTMSAVAGLAMVLMFAL